MTRTGRSQELAVDVSPLETGTYCIQTSFIEITAIVLLMAKIHSANHGINYTEMGPGLKAACHIALVGTGSECY